MSENQRDPQYKLRWSEELRQKVAQSAKAYNRSMNADIIARLERSFLTESEFSPLNMPPEELAQRLKTIVDQKNQNQSEKVVISREYLNELLEIKKSLRDLSLAVLDLEKHTLDSEAEEFIENPKK
ncbi:Arc family DNA-binding protein [Acinetobacter bouvetii]|uniref:Arc family DNA-binding protein n=1 Tax=Acinetobacter bouvetii TaxID=202951 RepID=A0A4Q7AUD7_9GAMM|nr:Arc family DNA-binding protein [Acinetobacter bouvetii]RZG63966.1 Arc family DNA-binding protein [Acinetobacter bouvetii]